LQAGGQQFNYIECLNDSPQWLSALADFSVQQLAGWPTQSSADDGPKLAASRAAALALGARQ
jgi:protoporphyrin/coproporphyrin ferrochelatase